ncbi:MAG TPA: copper homeostasis protein CutC [Fimbriimonas sp.]|nr:copper homeostasis protein CutC [Fimbriimonas sp.]
MLVEVIACSPSEVTAVAEGGADRIELCAALEIGGVSPNWALFEFAKTHTDLPIAVMCRPRTGNYQYSTDEIDFMCGEIAAFAKAGADFLVVGASGDDFSLNVDALNRFLDAADGTPLVCHRCFDQVPCLESALETLMGLGYRRVLTSGAQKTAQEGAQVIRKLVDQSDNRIEVLPAAGIRHHNVQDLITSTGVRQVHASVRSDVKHTPHTVDYGPTPVVLATEVRRFVEAAKALSSPK